MYMNYEEYWARYLGFYTEYGGFSEEAGSELQGEEGQMKLIFLSLNIQIVASS